MRADLYRSVPGRIPPDTFPGRPVCRCRAATAFPGKGGGRNADEGIDLPVVSAILSLFFSVPEPDIPPGGDPDAKGAYPE